MSGATLLADTVTTVYICAKPNTRQEQSTACQFRSVRKFSIAKRAWVILSRQYYASENDLYAKTDCWLQMTKMNLSRPLPLSLSLVGCQNSSAFL